VTGSTPPPYPRFRFVAAVAGDRAVMGCDVDDAVTALQTGEKTRLQNGQCGQQNAPVAPPDGETPSGATTTVPPGGTTPTTTPGTVPPVNATVAQLLADAQKELDAAQAALEEGDLGAYQEHVGAAREDVRRANALAGSSTTTTRPGASTTTTRP
jgi:hypothetical protein